MKTLKTITIQDIALKQIETTKKVYLLSPQRMFSEYNGEKENVKNYNGRQLLEMLQNADDAASEAKDQKKVLIKLVGDKLIIANTGYKFSEEGLNSIFHSHLSPKEAKENQIGNKGLGFRSILSWSNKITIKSHELAVAFSKENSKKVLEELLLNEDFKKEFKKLNKGHLLPIATLVCPDVKTAEIITFDGMKDFDTIIQIDLQEKAIKEVINQINHDLDAEVLIFLNNLLSIEIDINGEISGFIKNPLSPKTVKIESYNNTETKSKIWNVNALSGQFADIDRHYQLSLAWQDDLNESKDVIYAYFRTKVPIKCKGILHGSFELNADRNLIIDDADRYNERLVELLPELIAQTAVIIAENEIDKVNYNPISFLHFDVQSLGHLTDIRKLKDNLEESIKSKEIFPVISNKYISWNDKPAYYEEEEFANYLNPEEFEDLLLCCNNQENKELILKLDPATYEIESIIDAIAEMKDELSVVEYSIIISSIYNHIDDKKQIENRALFYDKNKKLLSFNDLIFLPNNGNNYLLPSNLGVQLINTELAETLLKVTNQKDYNSLAGYFEKLGIKEYNFTEIVEILISHFSSLPITPEKIINLNKHLFDIYSAEVNKEPKWLGTPIRILSKKGNMILAKELYFGKDYGNHFIEEIYGYNKDKILAPPSKLNLDLGVINFEDWKSFFEWLGVCYYPRKIIINGEKEYAEYVMRLYDYKNLVDNYHFKGGYIEFKNHLTNGYGTIKVISIDEIDNILKNNTSEKILQLIALVDFLLNSLDKDTEPQSSYINFLFYKTSTTKSISGNKLNSYLKWKIQFTPWLNTESNKKSEPSKCSTAAYINEDFQELVEKPKLDFEILRRININREKAEYLLSIIGVHKSINTFSTEMLYSILLKLPEIDLDGRKSKTIYNQLAANFDDKLLDKLDKTDKTYIDFHRNGKVFCKSGTFESIKATYYVNDKRYGESIIKQFKTIEIDRRRGKEKIRSLFGVLPLDKIDINLLGTPILHSLNSIFENEIESFKPYVYVLRMDVDNSNEKTIIRETKFKLVTDIEVELSLNDFKQKLTLNEYEYFYLKTRNTIFINVPKDLISIQNLKDDISFCSSIAETFSAILDVDLQRQQIRELFSKSNYSRDELIRNEMDDDSLHKLNDAREKLGIANNPKIDFWKSFIKCFKGVNISISNELDSDLLNILSTKFPKFKAIIESVFNEINYLDINEEISSELIISLFKKTGIEIEQFNQFHYPSVDITELYEINFKRAIDKFNNKFRLIYFNKCKTRIELQKNFLEILNRYNFLHPIVLNEVDFNVETDIKNQIQNEFNIDILEETQSLDVNDIYKVNLEKVWQIITEINDEKSLFEQFIKENIEVQSLLYFENQFSEIEEKYKIWIGKNDSDKNDNTLQGKSKRITFGTQTILYDTINDLKSQIDNVIELAMLNNISLKNIKTQNVDLVNKKSKGNDKQKHIKPKVPKEEIGFLGEYLVYRYLLETVDAKDSVKWVSEYAKDCNINPLGRDGLGYDIEYLPNGARYTRYVEVKVVNWENSFHISSNEVKYGEKLKKYYEIFLVRNIDNLTNLEIEKIQGLFVYNGNSFTSNDQFSVINDNFIIKFNKEN